MHVAPIWQPRSVGAREQKEWGTKGAGRSRARGWGGEQVLTDNSKVYLCKLPYFDIRGQWELGSRGSGSRGGAGSGP